MMNLKRLECLISCAPGKLEVNQADGRADDKVYGKILSSRPPLQ